jgi:DNA-binding IclR family transcriptional regulator
MSLDIPVLRALLRLSRSRTPPTLAALLVRVDADPAGIQRALRSLARAGLVHTTPSGPRLTMAGFAVAVAMTSPPTSVASRRKPRPIGKERPVRVIPLLRRPAA